MLYQIYGDYGLASQQLLEEFNYLPEARAWLRGYTTYDLGGYDYVYLMDKQEKKIYQAVYAEENA